MSPPMCGYQENEPGSQPSNNQLTKTFSEITLVSKAGNKVNSE